MRIFEQAGLVSGSSESGTDTKAQWMITESSFWDRVPNLESYLKAYLKISLQSTLGAQLTDVLLPGMPVGLLGS